MTEQELLYTIALTKVTHLNSLHQHRLLETLGSATEIYRNRTDIRQVIPDASPALCKSISTMDAQLSAAEEEIRFTQSKHIQCLGLQDDGYPARLRECPDSPILLYYRGNADLNTRHIVSIVGTRKITEYGKMLCQGFLRDLRQLCPDALIVSGLAYGADIHAQRNALEQGMSTIGVIAHGLDQIYPRIHRDTAVRMVSQGGLLTEYPSHTAIDKMNFVARNRIVAGIADSTVVIESADKGGSLITARIARDYNRDVFAFPGRITDPYSAGCNQLIARSEALALTSAEEFMKAMGWQSMQEQQALQKQYAQRELFPELTGEEQRIVDALGHNEGKAVNQISIETNIPSGTLSGLLFALEMKGIVKMMNGGMYRLMG